MNKTLSIVLQNIATQTIYGNLATQIGSVQQDSRKVTPDCLFVALRGVQTDGHQYLPAVLAKGVAAVLCETPPDEALLQTLPQKTVWIQVENSAKALALLACNFYDHPSKKLKLVGVTGTNGKTTTVTLLYQLFKNLGYKTGLLSTVQNHIEDEILPATHTTPDALTLNELLAKMVKKGCQYAFMEVSSHALVQERVTGIDFAGAVFTNITHDHLDYHKTFDKYIKAKKLLFDNLKPHAFALLNKDDKRATIMAQNCASKIYSFALQSGADFKAKILANGLQGLHLLVEHQEVWFQLIGEFNAYNLLGIYGTAVLLGEPKDEVLRELSALRSAAGRFEVIQNAVGTTGIVDYAHTPDALQNVLETIDNLRNGNEKVITVVGCGGNRDATKRPIMAAIACKLSNIVILTSDNPRFENPNDILAAMEVGVPIADKNKVLIIADRKAAIKKACELAQPQDVILVAGKGHETYQEIQGVKYDFDDRLVLKELL